MHPVFILTTLTLYSTCVHKLTCIHAHIVIYCIYKQTYRQIISLTVVFLASGCLCLQDGDFQLRGWHSRHEAPSESHLWGGAGVRGCSPCSLEVWEVNDSWHTTPGGRQRECMRVVPVREREAVCGCEGVPVALTSSWLLLPPPPQPQKTHGKVDMTGGRDSHMSHVWLCGVALQTPVNHCRGRTRATVQLECVCVCVCVCLRFRSSETNKNDYWRFGVWVH